MKATVAAVIVSCLSFLAIATTASAAALIQTQKPCVSASGFCLSFSAPGNAIPIIRSIAFTAATTGTAEVTFHGSLYCANTSGTISDKVVDVVTQIVDRINSTVDPNGPGSLRLAVVLKDTQQNAQNTSETFNLATARVLVLSPGTYKFSFKIAALRMDPGTTCYVYNAVFSIIFVP